ncbi:MAG: hypothetical protein JSV43_00245 [Methanobacteriota archaeon]|nr:MAG: hypothetical protein JSV43_00245 [Euryarchaeota archaeon]
MEVENVLLALEERDKWVERRKKLQKKLAKIRERKASVLKELEEVKRQVARYDGMVTSLKDSKSPKDTPTVPSLR